ncbi:MAG: hypothetical protein ACK55Z_20575, partial [bacterium]
MCHTWCGWRPPCRCGQWLTREPDWAGRLQRGYLWQQTGEVLHPLDSSPKDSTATYSPPNGSQGASLNMDTVPEKMSSGAPQAHSPPKSSD